MVPTATPRDPGEDRTDSTLIAGLARTPPAPQVPTAGASLGPTADARRAAEDQSDAAGALARDPRCSGPLARRSASRPHAGVVDRLRRGRRPHPASNQGRVDQPGPNRLVVRVEGLRLRICGRAPVSVRVVPWTIRGVAPTFSTWRPRRRLFDRMGPNLAFDAAGGQRLLVSRGGASVEGTNWISQSRRRTSRFPHARPRPAPRYLKQVGKFAQFGYSDFSVPERPGSAGYT